MKTEELNKLLDVLERHVHTRDAASEIDAIRNTLNARRDLPSRVEALCGALSLLFSVPVDDLLLEQALRAGAEAIICWDSNREKILDAVDEYLDRESVPRLDGFLIQSLMVGFTSDLEGAVRWAEEARRIAEGLRQWVQTAWSEYICASNLLDRASELYKRDELRAAEAAVQQAIRFRPSLFRAWIFLAAVYIKQNKLSGALVACKRAQRIAPKDWRVHQVKGEIYHKWRQLEKAETAFRKAITLSGNNEPDPLSHLGLVQQAQGKELCAVASYRRALSLVPTCGTIRNNLGNAFNRLGLYEEAISEYRQAIVLEPREGVVSRNLISCLLERRRFEDGTEELGRYLASQLEQAELAPLKVARDFASVLNIQLLTRYELVARSGFPDKPPGCGEHLVDHYLAIVQQALICALESQEMDSVDAITSLLHVCALWCLYGDKLSQKGLSKRFAREQLYLIGQKIVDVFPDEASISGFASMWPELKIRMKRASPKEFAQEMLSEEQQWLDSVGKKRKRGEVEDLRWRLLGNLWVRLFEYEHEQTGEHFEQAHYFMELLKGHTVLHKLADPRVMGAAIDRQRWNRYVQSLPVKIDKTAVVDLEACIDSLPPDAVALSFYFLHRVLLPDRFIVVVLKPGKSPCLRSVETGPRLEKFQDVARRLNQVHHQVAIERKVPTIGRRFCKLLGEEGKKEFRGRDLIKAVAEWEKKQLREAYEAILEGVIDVEELRDKDLYVSPSPEMYNIPFGLLLKGDQFLNSIAKSITIVPIFSLRQFQRKGCLPDKEGLVLCLDPDWKDDASNRAKSLSGTWSNATPHQKIEHRSCDFRGDVRVKYNEWIRAIVEMGRAHIIGHHDARQWSRSTIDKPNLGQFGRHLYEATEKLFADILSLEACWGGTWSEPEDLMGLFVSFLASGVSHVIASPYSVVPAGTSGKLFERIYGYSLETGYGNIGLQIARSVREAAEQVRLTSLDSEDIIPTLWGAYQLFAVA